MRHALLCALLTTSLALTVGACSKKDKDGKNTKAKPTDQAKPTTGASKNTPPPAVTIASAEDLAKRMQQCIRFINAHDMAKMGSCYAEDMVLNRVDVQPAMPTKGRAELMKQTEMYQKSFSEANLEPHLILVKDKNELVTIGMGSGKQTGDFFGMKSSGNRIGILEAMHSKFDGKGQITREDVYFDQATWFAQITDSEMPHREAMDRTGKPPKVVIAKGDKQEADNLAVMKTVYDAMNAHDAKQVMALYQPDAIFSYNAAHEDSKGTEAIGKQLAEYFAMSTDVKFTPEWSFAAGNYAVARVNSKGTNNGPLPMSSKPATNKTFDTNQLDVYEFKDGKVAQQWIFSNGLAAAVQLGLIDMNAMMKGGAEEPPPTGDGKGDTKTQAKPADPSAVK